MLDIGLELNWDWLVFGFKICSESELEYGWRLNCVWRLALELELLFGVDSETVFGPDLELLWELEIGLELELFRLGETEAPEGGCRGLDLEMELVLTLLGTAAETECNDDFWTPEIEGPFKSLGHLDLETAGKSNVTRLELETLELETIVGIGIWDSGVLADSVGVVRVPGFLLGIRRHEFDTLSFSLN